jgi:hypothetical protein
LPGFFPLITLDKHERKKFPKTGQSVSEHWPL